MSIIEIQNLRKVYPGRQNKDGQKEVEAVKGISFSVGKGEIFGLLGPNGAGKSTTQHMLTTLIPPTDGEAIVAGYHIGNQPEQVRQRIGYVSQVGGTDDLATGFENLFLQAQLYGKNRHEARQISTELIEKLQLDKVAQRPASTYSGGERRRLAIALALVHNPELLFLDEPTIGLDPQVRQHLWDEIRVLRDNGTTIFLTTHYLDEADTLADRLAIMDHGIIVADGTPNALKRQITGDIVNLRLEADEMIQASVKQQLQSKPYIRQLEIVDDELRIYVEGGGSILPDLLRTLDGFNIKTQAISLSQPTLDDVFLHHTGRSLNQPSAVTA